MRSACLAQHKGGAPQGRQTRETAASASGARGERHSGPHRPPWVWLSQGVCQGRLSKVLEGEVGSLQDLSQIDARCGFPIFAAGARRRSGL